MNISKNRIPLLVLAFVAGLVTWSYWTGRMLSGPGARPVEIDRTSDPVEGIVDLAAIDPGWRARATGAVPQDTAEIPRELPEAALDAEQATGRLEVLHEGSLAPLSQHRVRVSGLDGDPRSKMEVQLDEHGTADIAIGQSPGDFVRVIVLAADGSSKLHREHLRTGSYMPVLVPSPVVLTGTVRAKRAELREDLHVRIDELLPSSNGRSYLGRATISEGDRFHIEARTQQARPARARITVTTSHGSILSSQIVPFDALTSEIGYEVVLAVEDVEVSVFEASGRPVPGACVVLGPAEGPPYWSFELSTDVAGRAEARVPDGSLEYAVQADGYLPLTGRMEPSVPLVVHLTSLEEAQGTGGCEVTGTVGCSTGPIEGALISANLSTLNPELGFKALTVQVESAADGTFAMEVPPGVEFGIQAYSEGLGLSRRQRIRCPVIQHVEIQLESSAEVELVPASFPLELDSFGGYAEAFIMNVSRQVEGREAWRSTPYYLGDLKPGEYLFFLRVPEVGAYGVASATVTPQADRQYVPLHLLKPETIMGRVLDRSGDPIEGAGVTLIPSGIFRTTPREWRSVRTSGDGTYRLPLLDLGQREVHVEVSTPKGHRVRRAVSSGSINEHRIALHP